MFDITEKSFEYASASTKFLTTLATGIIAFSVTFSKEFAEKPSSGGQAVLLLLSWVVLLLSAILGGMTLLAITGEIDPPNRAANHVPSIRAPKVKFYLALQVITFVLGVLLIVGYGGVKVIAGPPVSPSPTPTPTPTPTAPPTPTPLGTPPPTPTASLTPTEPVAPKPTPGITTGRRRRCRPKSRATVSQLSEVMKEETIVLADTYVGLCVDLRTLMFLGEMTSLLERNHLSSSEGERGSCAKPSPSPLPEGEGNRAHRRKDSLMTHYYYEVGRSWTWTLKEASGRIVAQSRHYDSKRECLDDLERVKSSFNAEVLAGPDPATGTPITSGGDEATPSGVPATPATSGNDEVAGHASGSPSTADWEEYDGFPEGTPITSGGPHGSGDPP